MYLNPNLYWDEKFIYPGRLYYRRVVPQLHSSLAGYQYLTVNQGNIYHHSLLVLMFKFTQNLHIWYVESEGVCIYLGHKIFLVITRFALPVL